MSYWPGRFKGRCCAVIVPEITWSLREQHNLEVIDTHRHIGLFWKELASSHPWQAEAPPPHFSTYPPFSSFPRKKVCGTEMVTGWLLSAVTLWFTLPYLCLKAMSIISSSFWVLLFLQWAPSSKQTSGERKRTRSFPSSLLPGWGSRKIHENMYSSYTCAHISGMLR